MTRVSETPLTETSVPAVAGDDSADVAGTSPASVRTSRRRQPLYWRLLRLRHVWPNGWQRAALGEGSLALAVLLVLADVASAWVLVVLPVTVALVVKAHDLLAGLLEPVNTPTAEPGAREAGAGEYDGVRVVPGPVDRSA